MEGNLFKIYGGSGLLDGFDTCAVERQTDGLPYQLTPIEFSEKEMKRLNISSLETYYNITKDGVKIHDGIFRRGAFSSDIKDLNTKRFVELIRYEKERYSDDIVKECRLKSPYYLDGRTCVFDMEAREIVYTVQNSLDSIIFLFGNLCVNNISNGVLHLPSRKWVLGKSDNLDGYIETKDYLFARTWKYDVKNAKVYRVDKETGEVVDCAKI